MDKLLRMGVMIQYCQEAKMDGVKSDPTNYRPISILLTVSKIFEKTRQKASNELFE